MPLTNAKHLSYSESWFQSILLKGHASIAVQAVMLFTFELGLGCDQSLLFTLLKAFEAEGRYAFNKCEAFVK